MNVNLQQNGQTVLDKHENVTAEFLKSFSIVRSIQYLFTVSPNDQPPINLLKLGAMIFIVSGHMLIYIFGYPIYNGDYTEEVSPQFLKYYENQSFITK